MPLNHARASGCGGLKRQATADQEPGHHLPTPLLLWEGGWCKPSGGDSGHRDPFDLEAAFLGIQPRKPS